MSDMTYSESAKGVTITHSRAIAELTHHGIYSETDQAEALEYAKRSAGLYSAAKLLDWLGY